MEPEKNTPPASDNQAPAEGAPKDSAQAPADALSRTPEDLDQDPAVQAAAAADKASADAKSAGEKKPSAFKRIYRKVNLYFLLFMLILVIVGAITAVNYLNSTKQPEEPSIATKSLDAAALKQLANTDATVGNTSQTLTIQGNAIISGQTLMRGNLNVAGNIQSGGSIQTPNITVSGTSNLGTAQINSLQVATNTAIQGSTTLRDLNVAGAASFSGAITASQITVSRLILSGNGVLQVPNHISFSGPSPGRAINAGVLGAGGSASVNGSDTTGTININSGTNPTAGCFIRVNFAQAFSTQPHVIISPIGAAAGQVEYYVDRNNSGFSICTSTPAPAGQAFGFDYFVTG